MTIKFREDQTISDAARFRKAMEEADRYMIGHHPHAIAEGLKTKRQALERLDHRFKVIVAATESGFHLNLVSTESVKVKFVFKGDDDRQAKFYSDLIGKGLPFEIKPGELKVEGSALLNKLVSEAEIIQRTSTVNIEMNVAVLDDDGVEVIRVPIQPAIVEGGIEELRLRAAMQNSILVVSGTMADGTMADFRLNYNLERWAGQPIQFLGYFDQLKKMFAALAAGKKLLLNCSYLGYPLVGGEVGVHRERWVGISSLIDCIARARELAARFGAFPFFPEKLDVNRLTEVDEVYEQLHPGPISARDFDQTTSTQREMLRREAAQHGGSSLGQGTVFIHFTGGEFNLFGQTIAVPEFVSEITNVKPHVEDLTAELAKDSANPVMVRWRGTAESVRRSRPVTSDDLNYFEKSKEL